MAYAYLPILIILLLAGLIGAFVVAAGHLIGPHHPNERKGQPYESGMVPYGPGARRISIRYYLVSILFILFDVELIFFLPWAVVFKKLGVLALVEMGVFTVILLVGYVYAWKKGALEWE